MLSAAASAGLSAAFVFLDRNSAFYSVIRQGLFGQNLSVAFLCSFLKYYGVSPAEIDEWERQAQQDAALQDQSPLAQQITADDFCNAHFHMRGLEAVARTSRGTRPGDPSGDTGFNIVMQKVMREARARIASWGGLDLFEGRWDEAISSGQICFADVAFFDDVAFGLIHRANPAVIKAAAITAAALCDSARTRGSQVTFKPEKIELMPMLRGPGVRKFKHNLWVTQGGQIPVLLENHAECLRLVRSYKHLGSFVQCDSKTV